jgi:methylated-DNA-[protein]-cysteine S-methyltransferase
MKAGNSGSYTAHFSIPTRIPLRFDDGRAVKDVLWRADFSEQGLSHLTLLRQKEPASNLVLPGKISKQLESLKDVLTENLAGRKAVLPWSFFDLEKAPDFHVRVWKAMREIPFGKTETYGETAEKAGSPMAFRACGQACGANRILLQIPCHRVVGSNGLGGFGCGLDIKRWLLALEQ